MDNGDEMIEEELDEGFEESFDNNGKCYIYYLK